MSRWYLVLFVKQTTSGINHIITIFLFFLFQSEESVSQSVRRVPGLDDEEDGNYF
jgi:hypothetical protein